MFSLAQNSIKRNRSNKCCCCNISVMTTLDIKFCLRLRSTKNRSVWPTLEKTCVIEKFKANVGTATDQMCW